MVFETRLKTFLAIVAAGSILAAPEVVHGQSTDGPMAKGAIPEQRLRVEGWSVTLNVREAFEASGALVITADSLDETVAMASAKEETVTIVPVKKGATVIEVVAQNSVGSALQRIPVTVGAAVPPMAYRLGTVAATKYRITNPQDVAVDGDGNLYVVESLAPQGHRIHTVDAATGTVNVIAGTGEDGYSGDGGPAIQAQLNQPEGLAVDSRRNLYVADFFNHRVRKVDPATGTISTIAGTGEQGYSGDGGPAAEAMLSLPADVAVDADGSVYIAEGSRVRKVDAATGTISTIAGMGERDCSGGGGPATEVGLCSPDGLAVDADGNVHISDGNFLRKVDAFTGIIHTVAGRDYAGSPAGEGNVGDGGPATEAQLGDPFRVAVDGSGNVYIADGRNHRIRRVDAFTGIIDTIAGTGEQRCCQGGVPATEIEVSYPNGIAVDAFGNVYFTETWGAYISDVSGRSEQDRVRVLKPLSGVTMRTPDATVDVSGYFPGFDAVRYEVESSDGIVETVRVMGSDLTLAALNAGEGVITVTAVGSDGTRATRTIPVTVDAAVLAYTISTLTGNSYVWDGERATRAWLESPGAVATDAIGNLYIADYLNSRVRKVDAATGVIGTVAGTGRRGNSGDGGPAAEAQLVPRHVAVDGAGNLYVTSGNRIRRVDPAGIISTIPHEVNPSSLRGLAVNRKGDIYFTQSFTNLVRKFDPAAGDTLTVAGGGYVDNFLVHLGKLSNPLSVAVDSFGNVYVADTQNQRIRRVSGFGGGIGTIAGTGERGYGGDGGPATQAMLASPNSVAVDSAGNLYIADGWNRRIRKVDAAAGTISTIAGTGERGYGGDGGPATQARLSPSGVTVDGARNLYIADGGNNRIRKVDAATGTISTIAGTGEWGYSGDGGPAAEARLAFPDDVAVDAAGNVYISDNSNNRIRKVDAATGTISTIAGTGEQGYSGDGGPATEAGLYSPNGVSVDGSGNVYIADSVNHRIRKIDAATATISTIAGTGEGGYSGDGGLATGARLSFPSGVAIGSDCRVFIADSENHRIRVLKPNLALESGGCASAPP